MSGSGLSDLWPPPVYFDHSCPVSHHLVLFPFEFRFVCFVSRLHVLCPVFGFPSRCNLFSICCLARLLSFCPGYVFRPVFYSTNATFFVELVPKNKVHVTPSVPFHLHCSVVCPDILSTVQYILLEYYAPFVYARVGEGSGRAMGDSGSCSGVLKYAVTWYCISTFTSHLSQGSGGVGGGGRVGKLV
jgi:hypothetical protein